MLYVKGMSQRDIEGALVEALGVEGSGCSVINEVCRSLRENFERWQNHSLETHKVVYLFLDGTCLTSGPKTENRSRFCALTA